MISITISIFLFVLVVLPPLKLWLLKTTGIVQSQGEILLSAFAGPSLLEYGIPLAVIFSVLARKKTRESIVIQVPTLWFLRIINAIIIACWVISLKQSIVPGKTLAIIMLIAVAVSCTVVCYILVSSYRAKTVLVTIFGTVLLMSFPLMSQVIQKTYRNNIWDVWCEKAVDNYYSPPVDVKRIQFIKMGELPVFEQINGNYYKSMYRERIGDALSSRGYINEYEDKKPWDKGKPLVLVQTKNNVREPLPASSASHIVTLKHSQELKEQSKSNYMGMIISVVNAETNITIAKRNIIWDSSGKRACGKIINGKIDSTDFVIRALALQSTINSRLSN